jgi:cellulase/cellobiase CelA1
MKILVAKIIPMNPSSCTPCAQRVVDFNAAIPAWASGKTTAQSPITVVDQFTNFSTASDTYDGVHPNAAGDQKMSDRWYPPLAALLSGVIPSVSPSASRSPSPSPSASRSPSPSPSPSGSPGTGKRCTATYRVASQWNNGFGAEVVVANTGTVAITGWTVVLVFGNGQLITQLWNGTYTQSGGTVIVKNMSYNGNIPVGGSVTFGFNGSWSGTNSAPTVTCTPA